MNSRTTPTSPDRSRWWSGSCSFERLLTVLLFLAIIVACALTPMQTDTWWQLRAGRDMLSARRVLLVDTYSYTAWGSFWPNHEWLAEIAYYMAFRIGGLPLVTLFATTLITSAWSITWLLTTGSARFRFVVTAAALVPASLHWEPRPHAFSLLFLMVTILAIVRKKDAWLPLLFLAWANCHGGVLTGLLVLGVGLAAAVIEEPQTWRRRGVTLVACVIGVTITPLGVAFWTEIPKSLARIRSYPLDEWQAPSLADARLLGFWLLAAGFCLLLVASGRRVVRSRPAGGLTLCACAIVLLPLAISAIRNVGPFLMVAIPAISVLFARSTLDLRLSSGASRLSTEVRHPKLNLAIMSGAVAAVVVAVVCAYALQVKHLRWTPLPPASLAALDRCPENLYNRYDEGGFLIWFAPGHRVFLDGRQDPYDPNLVYEQIRMETTGEYRAIFSRYGIRCAFLPASSPVAGSLLNASWTPLYRDSQWIVLTHAL